LHGIKNSINSIKNIHLVYQSCVC